MVKSSKKDKCAQKLKLNIEKNIVRLIINLSVLIIQSGHYFFADKFTNLINKLILGQGFKIVIGRNEIRKFI